MWDRFAIGVQLVSSVSAINDLNFRFILFICLLITILTNYRFYALAFRRLTKYVIPILLLNNDYLGGWIIGPVCKIVSFILSSISLIHRSDLHVGLFLAVLSRITLFQGYWLLCRELNVILRDFHGVVRNRWQSDEGMPLLQVIVCFFKGRLSADILRANEWRWNDALTFCYWLLMPVHRG